jgi:hypothetical protein
MYVYAGRTQNGLNNRLQCPYGSHAVSHRVLELLRKATGQAYSAYELVFNKSAITVIKSSKKNNSAEDEQKVINACWKFEQDTADSLGNAGHVFSLNAQGVDRSTRYCQNTYDALQTAFDACVREKGQVLLRGKYVASSFYSLPISKGRSKSVLKKALATLKRLKAKSIKREIA